MLVVEGRRFSDAKYADAVMVNSVASPAIVEALKMEGSSAVAFMLRLLL